MRRGSTLVRSVVKATRIRPARPDRDDGEQFARYFDLAADGLLRWMLGSGFVGITAKAFMAPGHDLSHEHTWFAESEGVIVGMANGFSAADHARSADGPLFRAAGIGSVRLVARWLVGLRLFRFMDRVPEGDWYLQAVAVDPAVQGSGVGSSLLDHAEGRARGVGARRLALDVADRNDGARRLYERRGMTVVATSPAVPLGQRTVVHRMTKAL